MPLVVINSDCNTWYHLDDIGIQSNTTTTISKPVIYVDPYIVFQTDPVEFRLYNLFGNKYPPMRFTGEGNIKDMYNIGNSKFIIQYDNDTIHNMNINTILTESITGFTVGKISTIIGGIMEIFVDQGITVTVSDKRIYRITEEKSITYYRETGKTLPGFHYFGIVENGIIYVLPFADIDDEWSYPSVFGNVLSGYVFRNYVVIITNDDTVVISRTGDITRFPKSVFIGMTEQYVLVKDSKWYYKIHESDTDVKVTIVFANSCNVYYNQGSDLIAVEYPNIYILYNTTDLSKYDRCYRVDDCRICFTQGSKIFKSNILSSSTRTMVRENITNYTTVDRDSASVISDYC